MLNEPAGFALGVWTALLFCAMRYLLETEKARQGCVGNEVRQRASKNLEHVAFSLQSFHEQRMPFVLRLLWCVLLLPCPEMMEVIGQHPVASAFFLAVSLFRGRLSDMGLDSVLLSVVVADTEIVSQLHSGSFAGQSEQTGNKINCISVRLASETMKTLVHLHAGILVIVKRADCHAMTADRNAVHPYLT